MASYGTFNGEVALSGARTARRSRLLASAVCVCAALTAVVFVVGLTNDEPVEMYDSLDHRRGKSFPQNEQAWLEMAAGMGKPMMAKSAKDIKTLDDVRTKAQEWVSDEKAKAYATAKKLAVEENYDTYDKFKGIANHKAQGAASSAAAASTAS